MQFSFVALFAAVAVAAVPNMASRNVPTPCDTQLQQCNDNSAADAAECDTRQTNCLSSCEAGFKSCYDAPATIKANCYSVFEKCAGHPHA